MSRTSDELVRVASGTAMEMELLKQQLVEEGIDVRIEGESLGIGLGTAIPGSVELIVMKPHEARARAIIGRIELSATEQPKFPHPVSDPKPKDHGGHGPHTHYNANPKS